MRRANASIRIVMEVAGLNAGKDPRLVPRSLNANLRLNMVAKEYETGPGRLLLGTDKAMAEDTCDFCNAQTHKRKKLKLPDFQKFMARYCEFHWQKYDKGRGDPRHDYEPVAYEDSEAFGRK